MGHFKRWFTIDDIENKRTNEMTTKRKKRNRYGESSKMNIDKNITKEDLYKYCYNIYDSQFKVCNNDKINEQCFISVFNLFVEEKIQVYKKDLDKRRLYEKHVLYSKKNDLKNNNIMENVSGEIKFKTLINLVKNRFIFKPEKFQMNLLNMAFNALCPNILGNEWQVIGQRMMKEYNWKFHSPLVIASAPRRFGKSVSMSLLIVSYALISPGKEISVYSTGTRASNGLKNIVIKILCESKDTEEALLSRGTSQETILIQSIYGGLPCKVNFYPANEKISIFFLNL